jgi:hypothetical protein
MVVSHLKLTYEAHQQNEENMCAPLEYKSLMKFKECTVPIHFLSRFHGLYAYLMIVCCSLLWPSRTTEMILVL